VGFAFLVLLAETDRVKQSVHEALP